MTVRYCKQCVTPDTWPDAVFDDEGVCLPCSYAQNLDSIDWESRAQELAEIATWGRRNSYSEYDCIIGVSGGKDSIRQAFYVRDVLGLKPLLVSCAYPPEQVTERGANNLGNLARHGFDMHIIAPAPGVSKKLMRFSLEKYGNLYRATELALYASMPREAVALGIPLIFLGENPSLAFGGKVGSFDSDANHQRTHNTLSGARVDEWLEADVSLEQLLPYCYPRDEDIARANLRMVYLGYFIRDFNDIKNTAFAMSKGLESRTGIDACAASTGSINPADAVDDEFVHVNQFFKYLKLGFGKVTQQASVKIRLGAISRDEGIELVKNYDGKCSDKFILKICDYLKISWDEMHRKFDQFRNREIWQFNNHGEWELREPIVRRRSE